MNLELMDVYYDSKNKKIYRNFESMGKKLLLVKMEVYPRDGYPFHWLLENGKKPPFDIAINKEDASISYIKFFFQDEKIKKIDKVIKVKSEKNGFPKFNIGNFNQTKYQIFNEGDANAFFDGLNLCLIISSIEIHKFLNLDENNVLLFSNDGFFAGVLFKNLLKDEIEELKFAQIL